MLFTLLTSYAVLVVTFFALGLETLAGNITENRGTPDGQKYQALRHLDHGHHHHHHDHYHAHDDHDHHVHDDNHQPTNVDRHLSDNKEVPTSHDDRVKCNTEDPSEELMAAAKLVTEMWLQDRPTEVLEVGEVLTIPTCMHVIRPSSNPNPNFLNVPMLQAQLDSLNNGFTSSSCCDPTEFWCLGECSQESGIQFAMALVDDDGVVDLSLGTSNVVDATTCITRTINDDWYFGDTSSEEVVEMKTFLRQGDESVFNIYFTGLPDALGVAVFPQFYAVLPIEDGTVIRDTVIVGGSLTRFNEGDTLVHEAGHWLGLFHTFQGGCDGGDQIDDTPPEETSASGCPIGRDTCVGGGVDPIHNFMDYSDDACLYEFTADQVTRMLAQHAAYRIPKPDIILTSGVESDLLDLVFLQVQVYVIDVGPSTRVECISSSLDDVGDADMFVRIDAYPLIGQELYDCVSQSVASDETCVAYADEAARVYISMFAFSSFTGVSLTCTAAFAPPPIQLTSGLSSDAFSLGSGQSRYFRMDAPMPGRRAFCQLLGDNGNNAALFLRWNTEPTIPGFDCASQFAGSVDECLLVTPLRANSLWVRVLAASPVANVLVTCWAIALRSDITLKPNVPSDPLTVSIQEVQNYRLEIQPYASVTCTASAASGQGTMSMNWEVPVSGYGNPSEAECQSALSEDCQLVDLLGSFDLLWVTVRANTELAGLTVTCTLVYPDALPLANRVGSPLITLCPGQTQLYILDVIEEGLITCNADSSSGDLDLYLRLDEAPNLESGEWDCISNSFGSVESCLVLANPGAGSLFVLLEAYADTVESATVRCVFARESIELLDGVPSIPFSRETGEVQNFVLDVPENEVEVLCGLSGDNGDADLYLHFGEEAEFTPGIVPPFIADCSSANVESNDACSAVNRDCDPILWVSVLAFLAFENVTLTCSVTETELPAAITLTLDVPSDPVALIFPSNEAFYILDINEGDEIQCVTDGFGDVDLYLRLGKPPDRATARYDCRGFTVTAQELCTVTNDGDDEVLWVMLHGFSDSTNATVTCNILEVPPTSSPAPSPGPPEATDLASGVSTEPFSLNSTESALFSIDTVAGDRVQCDMTADSGSLYLVLRFDAEPLPFASNDCVDLGIDTSCVVFNDQNAALVYVKVEDLSDGSENITLTCTVEAVVEPPAIELSEGIPSDSIDLMDVETQTYTFTVSLPSVVTCETTAEDGNLDLFVQLDTEPIPFSSSDCSSTSSGSDESCTVQADEPPAVLYAVLVPYNNGNVINATITCTSDVITLPLLDRKRSKTVDLAANSSVVFLVEEISTAATAVSCTAGDPDRENVALYIGYNSVPDVSQGLFDCSGIGLTSSEECTFPDLEAVSSLYVVVVANSQVTDLTIFCLIEGNDVIEPIELISGMPAAPLSLACGQSQYFVVQVKTSTNTSSPITTTTQGTTGTAAPEATPASSTSMTLAPGGLSTPAPITLTATVPSPGTASPITSVPIAASPITRLPGPASKRTSSPAISTPVTSALRRPTTRKLQNDFLDVACTLTGDNGDADLYVRYDELPDLANSLWDCASRGIDSIESCEVKNPGSSEEAFVIVNAYDAFSDVVLTCMATEIIDVTPAPTPATPSTYTTLFFAGFENDDNFFLDLLSGSAINLVPRYVYAGLKSMKIFAVPGASRSFAVTDWYDVSSYTRVQAEFHYKPVRLDHMEGFYLEYQTSGDPEIILNDEWNIASRYKFRVDFTNRPRRWWSDLVEWSAEDISFMRLRFRLDASRLAERLYIDNVSFRGR